MHEYLCGADEEGVVLGHSEGVDHCVPRSPAEAHDVDVPAPHRAQRVARPQLAGHQPPLPVQPDPSVEPERVGRCRPYRASVAQVHLHQFSVG